MWKIKKNGGYLFLLQLLLPHNPDISHSALYLKTETHKAMEKYVHTSVIPEHNQSVERPRWEEHICRDIISHDLFPCTRKLIFVHTKPHR